MQIKDRRGRRWLFPDDEELVELWNIQELSASKIARIMKRTRNGIIGRAHRIGCIPRMSPITKKIPMQTAYKERHYPSKLVAATSPGDPSPKIRAADVMSVKCMHHAICGNQAVPRHTVCYECAGRKFFPKPSPSQAAVAA